MTQTRFTWKSALILAAIVLLSAPYGGCGSDSSPAASGPTGPAAPVLANLIVSEDPISIQVGQSRTITASGQYSDFTLNPAEPVAWSVAPIGYATVDAAGQLTAVAVGLTYLTATAYSDPSVTKDVIVNVTAAPPPAPSITTVSLPGGTVGIAYSATLQRINGQGPFTWSILSGSLPLGLTLDAATGIISGTPTTVGNVSFTVKVTDSLAQEGTKLLSINAVLVVGT